MPTFRSRSVTNGEVQLWTEQSRADGSACLLIGGAGAISAFWPDPFCEQLASSGRSVIRYDHRDTGNSTFVDFDQNPYELTDLMDDAIAVLDDAGIEAAHVIGHSMGGFIAQLLAVRHPTRVRSFTSISSHAGSPYVPTPPPETWDVLLANVPCGEFDADLEGFMTVWRFLNGDAEFDVASAEGYTRELYRRNPKTLPATNHVASMANMKDRTPALCGTTIPALIVHGGADPLVPVDGGRMTADAVPDAKWLCIPEAGHMFFNSSIWGRLAQEMNQFLSSVDDGR